MRLEASLISCAILILCACGGGGQPADSADDADAAASEETSDSDKAEGESSEASAEEGEGSSGGEEPAADEDKDKDKDKAADKGKEESSSSSGPSLTRTPKDLLTAPDVLFMFSFNDSEVYQAAEQRCDEKSGKDPKKKAKCMAAEKEKIKIDGIYFAQEGGTWYYIAVRRKGKALNNVRKFPIEFGKETDKSITLKPTGKDKGSAPKPLPKEIVVETPNEYQIVTKDPDLGKVVWEAKIGLVGEQKR